MQIVLTDPASAMRLHHKLFCIMNYQSQLVPRSATATSARRWVVQVNIGARVRNTTPDKIESLNLMSAIPGTIHCISSLDS